MDNTYITPFWQIVEDGEREHINRRGLTNKAWRKQKNTLQDAQSIQAAKQKEQIMDLKPIRFAEANKNLLKPDSMTDGECHSLWVYSDGEECISCWKLTFRQRLRALIFGRIWLSVFSGDTQPPVWLGCGRTVFRKTKDGGAE